MVGRAGIFALAVVLQRPTVNCGNHNFTHLKLALSGLLLWNATQHEYCSYRCLCNPTVLDDAAAQVPLAQNLLEEILAYLSHHTLSFVTCSRNSYYAEEVCLRYLDCRVSSTGHRASNSDSTEQIE